MLNEKQWTQLTIVLTPKLVSFYVNGVLDLSFNAGFETAKCFNSKFYVKPAIKPYQTKITLVAKPKFKTKSKMTELEITRFYVTSFEINEEEAVELYFNCNTSILNKNVLFNWSNLNTSNIEINLFRNSGFCSGNRNIEILRH